jgi:hypothetical protein
MIESEQTPAEAETHLHHTAEITSTNRTHALETRTGDFMGSSGKYRTRIQLYFSPSPANKGPSWEPQTHRPGGLTRVLQYHFVVVFIAQQRRAASIK